MLPSNNRTNSKLNSSYAIASKPYLYGSAIGLERLPGTISKPRDSISSLLRFYFGEYFIGVLFVLALSAYAVLKPSSSISVANSLKNLISSAVKKSLDISLATIGLILALPLLVVVAILIKITSRGSIFYTQTRIGVNRRRSENRVYSSPMNNERRTRDRRRDNYCGRPFKVMKFRTMVNNAEAKSGPVWATKNDTRITPLGKFLRKTRIDEIPQMINVLKGEMSMVGPRPERPKFVKDLSAKVPDYTERLNVKPGITGQAQVTTGYDTSLESVFEKVKNDVEYIRNWNLWSDLKILLKTVLVVITGKGAC